MRQRKRGALFDKEPQYYQVIVAGKPRLLSELSKKELQQECMTLMDLIERIDGRHDDMTQIINEYREGRED
jgi:hypothetical protein